MHCIRGLILCLVLLLANGALAQLRVDTVRQQNPRDTGEFVMSKSPTLALAMSALLPGAGQIYLGQWWKTPVIYGLLGGFLYGAYVQNDRFKYTRDSVDIQRARAQTFRESADTATRLLAPAQDILADRYARVREFYRDDRDKWLIYTGLVYVATILDAYISAHLYDFNVDDPGPRPTLQVAPDYMRIGISGRF